MAIAFLLNQTTIFHPILSVAKLLNFLLSLVERLSQRCHLSRIDEVSKFGDSGAGSTGWLEREAAGNPERTSVAILAQGMCAPIKRNPVERFGFWVTSSQCYMPPTPVSLLGLPRT